ncbi:iron-containing alcohol dehydrogenase [Flintibacter sp. P01028]|uniref:iron-containing alcohol dehydrogenase n=1 Tax=Flintibacter sp. P01028 TaxID=3342382 RepID=UPI0035B60355
MHPLKKLTCRAFQLAFRLALPFLPYREPKQLDGLDSIPPLLKWSGVGSVLLVTDRSVRSLGLTAPLEKSLAEEGIICAVYDGTVPNPTIQNVEEGRQLYLDSGAQAIIAVGGGSVMDCAKGVGARIARPHKPVRRMKGLLRVLVPTPLTIAVPTTAGTGSEATLAAVITDPEKKHKYPINDFALIPDYAVLDPKITLGLPPFITATTGMDALTHAIESYIGQTTTKLTQAMSEEAARLIVHNLPRAFADGTDLEARRAMLRAAYCAGVSFTRSYVGYVHGLAHSLGGQYGIPHGLANAVILPYFLEEYGPACWEKLGKLAKAAGLAQEGDSAQQSALAFIAWIKEANRTMGIPETIAELRAEDIPAMARHADQECNPLYPVPRLMDRQELEVMYQKLMAKEASPWISKPSSRTSGPISKLARRLA